MWFSWSALQVAPAEQGDKPNQRGKERQLPTSARAKPGSKDEPTRHIGGRFLSHAWNATSRAPTERYPAERSSRSPNASLPAFLGWRKQTNSEKGTMGKMASRKTEHNTLIRVLIGITQTPTSVRTYDAQLYRRNPRSGCIKHKREEMNLCATSGRGNLNKREPDTKVFSSSLYGTRAQ